MRERLAALEGAPAEAAAPVTSARTETGRRRVALWIVAGGATLVLLVVLLVVAIGGGGGDENIRPRLVARRKRSRSGSAPWAAPARAAA